jgi:hypothetical protein
MIDTPQILAPSALHARMVRHTLPALSLYAAALFVSAFLLFWVQPLIAKMMLPLLGGAPAVWNTAMMFFQLVLLAGYGYAHLLTRAVPPRRQAWVHAAVLVAAAAMLPFSVGNQLPPADASSPLLALWLVGRLMVIIGLPFFALSAAAPLLQSWFTRTGHPAAGDPYFLYSASNLGSLSALLAFPIALEPLTSLSLQSRLWTGGFILLVVMVWACAGCASGRSPRQAESSAAASARTDWRARGLWMALAFVPSSLLLGVTSYITTDVASAPLLWVIPLALYLLSFVVTFARRPPIKASWALSAQAASIALLLLLFMIPTPPLRLAVPAHYLAFFCTAVVCHGMLAARRPAATQITEFYFCLSLGGALGGVFNALLAPILFSATYEYPLALILAGVLRGTGGAIDKPNKFDFLLPAGVLAAVVAVIGGWSALGAIGPMAVMAAVLAIALLVFGFANRTLRFALAVAAVLVPTTLVRSNQGVLEQQRSFFGVHRVMVDPNAPMLDLAHGTTTHGAEFTDPQRWRLPVRYYNRGGPIGQVFDRLRAARPEPQEIAVIGLGAGVLACYAVPGEVWTFYEIDSVVLRLVRDTRYFHYLEQCGGSAGIVLGDARRSLTTGPSHRYDLLILDAFNSDAIPMHLLTREAVALYLSRLADPGGVLALHISNRNLELRPMLAALAGDLGLSGRDQVYQPSPQEETEGAVASEWVLLARRPADLAFLGGEPRWTGLTSARRVTAWTDDFSNILSALRW